MNQIKALAAASAIAFMSSPAMADFLQVDSRQVPSYTYTVDINGASSPVSARYYNVTNLDTTDSFIAFCIEMGADVTTSAWNGTADMTPTATSDAAFPQSVVGIQSLYDQRFGSLNLTSSVEVAAFQLALWELTDTTNTGTDFFGTGAFRNYAGNQDAIALATDWLTNLSDPTPNVDTYDLTAWMGGATQDMISAARGASVPEPGTLALLGLAGIAGLGVTRRKKA